MPPRMTFPKAEPIFLFRPDRRRIDEGGSQRLGWPRFPGPGGAPGWRELGIPKGVVDFAGMFPTSPKAVGREELPYKPPSPESPSQTVKTQSRRRRLGTQRCAWPGRPVPKRAEMPTRLIPDGGLAPARACIRLASGLPVRMAAITLRGPLGARMVGVALLRFILTLFTMIRFKDQSIGMPAGGLPYGGGGQKWQTTHP